MFGGGGVIREAKRKVQKKVLFCHLGGGVSGQRTQWFTSLFYCLPKYRYFLF